MPCLILAPLCFFLFPTVFFLVRPFLEELDGGGYQSSAVEMVVSRMVLGRCEDDHDDDDDSGKAEESGNYAKSSGSLFTWTERLALGCPRGT
jgi:hypothetical protein